jgi:hypothetical protein
MWLLPKPTTDLSTGFKVYVESDTDRGLRHILHAFRENCPSVNGGVSINAMTSFEATSNLRQRVRWHALLVYASVLLASGAFWAGIARILWAAI